ncbi:MAG: acyl transferase [Saprospiraceae bacterium]|nr:acyl transferase [Saprospiraceae bacterium]
MVGEEIIARIFGKADFDFEELAMEIFKIQSIKNEVYKNYLHQLRIEPENVKYLNKIPFLPVDFFKYHDIKTGNWKEEKYFLSSGTTDAQRSKHCIKNLQDYHRMTEICLEMFISDIREYSIYGLLPGYIQNQHSSLIEMVRHFIEKSGKADYRERIFADFSLLSQALKKEKSNGSKILLFGVSFALLDFGEAHPLSYEPLTIIETGGMKTHRRDFSKEYILKKMQLNFPKSMIYSEYGMTEMMSQAYATDGMWYSLPSHARVFIRNSEDPFGEFIINRQGRVNVIDLGNLHSCCFLETADLGISNANQQFKIMGRIQNASIRGCNLMYEY